VGYLYHYNTQGCLQAYYLRLVTRRLNLSKPIQPNTEKISADYISF